MKDAEFDACYQNTLNLIEESIESFLDDADSELDFETVNGIMTLDCANGSIIITPQSATHQLWLAAKSGGYHFARNETEQQWQRTTDQQSLSELLAQSILEQDGSKIEFPAL